MTENLDTKKAVEIAIENLDDSENEIEDVIILSSLYNKGFNSGRFYEQTHSDRNEKVLAKIKALDNPKDLADYIKYICDNSRFKLVHLVLDDGKVDN